MWDIETKNYCPLETALFCNGVGFVRWSFMTHSGNHPSLMSRHILNQKDCSPWIIKSQSTHSLVNHEALKQILLIWCKLVYNSAIFYAKSRRLFFIVPGKKKCNEKRWTLGGEKTTLPVRKQSVQHEKVDLGALSTAYQAHCRALWEPQTLDKMWQFTFRYLTFR